MEVWQIIAAVYAAGFLITAGYLFWYCKGSDDNANNKDAYLGIVLLSVFWPVIWAVAICCLCSKDGFEDLEKEAKEEK
jgi:hypothetical protein